MVEWLRKCCYSSWDLYTNHQIFPRCLRLVRSFHSPHCASRPFSFLPHSYKILSSPDAAFHITSLYVSQVLMSGITCSSLDDCSIVSFSPVSADYRVSAKNHLYASSHSVWDSVVSLTPSLSFESLSFISFSNYC